MTDLSDSRERALRARQRFTVLALAGILIVGGLLILFFLEKMPRPMRIMAGLGDVFAGLCLLVLARQKFKRKPETGDRMPETGDRNADSEERRGEG